MKHRGKVQYIFKHYDPNPCSRTMALGSTQPLTEISTGIFLGVKVGRPACKADNLTAICEATV
jgi:hypothetical protein